MVQLPDSISERLHHHTLSNILSNGIFKAHCAQNLSCFGLGVNVWFITTLVFLAFWLFSPIFSTTLHTWFKIPHLSIVGIPRCVCTNPIDLLHYAHGNERIKTHNVIWNTFAVIVQNASFHVGQKQLHVLPLTTFNSSHQQVNIVFTKYDICTLIDVVIANPTWANLIPWSCTTQGFVAFNAIQAKERSYHNQYPIDQFLPLTIEIFACLHKHVNLFLHDCANAIWSLKLGPKGPHISILVIFLCQKVSITLQRMQTSSILSQAVVVGLTTSQLPPLQDTLPSPWLIYCKPLIWPTYHRRSVMDMERFWHLLWTNLASCHFFIFLNFTILYIFLI